MNTVQVLFRTRTAIKEEELLDKVQSYLAALLHNGQIVGDHTPLAKISGGLLVTASLPEADALGDRFANKWVRKSLRELEAAGVDRPKVTHLGADPESRKPCRCRKRPFLIMFTTFLNAEPPLRCGTCFGPVALYKVPATSEAGNHQDMLWWQDTYQAMDWLFIGTGPGERFAHDQLSRFDSQLSTDGRDLARGLEKKARVPVYYYLSKHFGRSDLMERKRKCHQNLLHAIADRQSNFQACSFNHSDISPFRINNLRTHNDQNVADCDKSSNVPRSLTVIVSIAFGDCPRGHLDA